MKDVLITPDGIQKNLKSFQPCDALCEYIWNGFDAGASTVSVELKENQLGLLNMIIVHDNGNGISYEDLDIRFQRFNDSTRLINGEKPTVSLPKGKRGIGRLTFFAFAQKCRWDTVYVKEGEHYAYYIEMYKDSINQFNDNDGKMPKKTNEASGTTVTFSQIESMEPKEIIDRIKSEFFWFLELKKGKGYRILINNEAVTYDEYVEERIPLDTVRVGLNHSYEIMLVKWTKKLGNEYSRVYYLDSDGEEKHKETTKLNRQKDQFYHSVFVKSDYFNSFHFETPEIEGQLAMMPNKSDDEYKKLMDFINENLISYRKKYLKEASARYIASLVDSQIYPDIDISTTLGEYKRKQLDDLVGTLYSAQPRIFTGLSDENKKIVLNLLNLIMEEGNKPELFRIIKQIIDLDDDEINELADVLKYTTLSNITRTVNLLKDRQKVIQVLKELVFDKSLNAYEVPHIQEVVQNHYWIFGERYNLITAAEPDFEQALLGLLKATSGNSNPVSIKHEDKNKEMDIYMIRQDRRGNCTENVVVELKRPSIKLGEKHLSQVKKYMRVIKADSRFNAGNTRWIYYLVGNSFDNSKYIEGELENCSNRGDNHLVFEADKGLTRVYVIKWSELFEELLIRHEYIMEKLNFEQELWLQSHDSADDAVTSLSNNSAKKEPAVVGF